MKIPKCVEEIKTGEWLNMCVDVGKDKLDVYTKYERNGERYELRDSFLNRSSEIRKHLIGYEELCAELSLTGARIICEPTGGYERKLLRMAHNRNHRSSYVASEATSKAKVIHSNDTGKTDQKDPEVIFTLMGLDRTLTSRSLPESYAHLRELNQYYEDESNQAATIRNHVHAVMNEQFCDFSYSNDFIFGATGFALYRLFQLNPHNIMRCDYSDFEEQMRGEVKGVRQSTLKKIYTDARASVLHAIADWRRELLDARLSELMTDWNTHNQRKQELRDKMVKLYKDLPECEKWSFFEGVSEFQLSRLLAETGPLSDFGQVRQLLRYAGLNIRERRSGKYKGQNRISKKGRALLRKVLYQIAFSSLIHKNGLYGPYYSQKKVDLANGKKAIVAVMRKFLKMIFGLAKSQASFDSSRVFLCYNDHLKKVA